MHTGRQPLLVGNALAQPSQLRPLLLVQSCAQAFFVFGSNAGEFTHQFAALIGEVQLVIAPVFCASPALQDPLGFKPVNQGHHAAGHDAKVLGQGLLADSRSRCDLAQQPRVGSRQSNLRHSFAETAGPMGSNLS